MPAAVCHTGFLGGRGPAPAAASLLLSPLLSRVALGAELPLLSPPGGGSTVPFAKRVRLAASSRAVSTVTRVFPPVMVGTGTS